jgi:hypothetical protein
MGFGLQTPQSFFIALPAYLREELERTCYNKCIKSGALRPDDPLAPWRNGLGALRFE